MGHEYSSVRLGVSGLELSFTMAVAVLLREATSRRFPGSSKVDRPADISTASGEAVGQEWLNGTKYLPATRDDLDKKRSPSTSPSWDSTRCMELHGTPELQWGVDPGGYLVFSDAREQLGNNRVLVSDGLAIAKALNRTLVECPASDSRIASADAQRGFCMYWDCDDVCRYHRILDLWTFRSMLRSGQMALDGFVDIQPSPLSSNLLKGLETAKEIVDFFERFREAQVIVVSKAWKSGLHRESLGHIRPNPFYEEVVRDLISRQKVVRRNHGILEMIDAAYPSALNNTVYVQLGDEEDTGIRAIVGGLVSASSSLLLSSSASGTVSNECQKMSSKYIRVVAEWRVDVYNKRDSKSVVSLFPSGAFRLYMFLVSVMAFVLLLFPVLFLFARRRRQRTTGSVYVELKRYSPRRNTR